MTISLNEEQLELGEVVASFLESTSDLKRILNAPETGYVPGADSLTDLGEQLGLTSIGIDEQYEGAGAGLTELAVVAEKMGAHLSGEPFFSTVLVTATVLEHAAAEEAKALYLPQIATGSLRCTTAMPGGDAATVTAEAQQSANGWKLEGVAKYVIDAAHADVLFIPAITPGGTALFAVDAHAGDLHAQPLEVLDRSRTLATLTFAGTDATLVAENPFSTEVMERVHTLLAAELLGVADASFRIALEYASQREQFGRPIGSFQSIKHILTDMYIGVETSRALIYEATNLIDAGTTHEPVAQSALAHVIEAATFVTSRTLQVLGGIGYTWEHPAHLYFKRVRANRVMLGSLESHRDAVAGAFLQLAVA